jgi:hypothetical protein
VGAAVKRCRSHGHEEIPFSPSRDDSQLQVSQLVLTDRALVRRTKRLAHKS